ncbi:hypothetical protein [Pimelobacter simplex]|uniref:hypothetical protein n=1 Tax=Nocardioides simplex TaxID=2045 RepID=UPI003AAC040D
MKVKIIEQPSGYVRIGDELMPWPEEGQVIDLPDVIADGMIASGTVEKISAPAKRSETRPAPKRGETRQGKRA